MSRIAPLGLVALVLAGCATAANAELTTRIEALETKVAAIEARPADPSAPGGPSDRDRKAYETFQELQAAVQKSDYDAAKALIATMETEYADIPAAMQAIAEVKKEIELIGSDAQDFEAIKWFTGKPTSVREGKATLLVFWEIWCPHCRREVPRIEEVHAKFGGQGLNVIGLTQVNNDRTDDEVAEFLKESKVTYPTAKVDGRPSEAFMVNGIPAAAIVKGGKIVWRGHPGNLTDDALAKWLEG